MKKITKFVREDDGEEFTLNDDGETFSTEFMKIHFSDSLQQQWTEEMLMRQRGFKPVYADD